TYPSTSHQKRATRSGSAQSKVTWNCLTDAIDPTLEAPSGWRLTVERGLLLCRVARHPRVVADGRAILLGALEALGQRRPEHLAAVIGRDIRDVVVDPVGIARCSLAAVHALMRPARDDARRPALPALSGHRPTISGQPGRC